MRISFNSWESENIIFSSNRAELLRSLFLVSMNMPVMASKFILEKKILVGVITWLQKLKNVKANFNCCDGKVIDSKFYNVLKKHLWY